MALLLVAGPAQAGNVIQKLQLLRDEARPKAARVVITCSEAPIFQVYDALNPRRVVVEMLATEIPGHLSADLPPQAPVRKVQLEQAQGASGMVARLHFAVDAGAVYDVRTERSVIVLTLFEDVDSDEAVAARSQAASLQLTAAKQQAEVAVRQAEEERRKAEAEQRRASDEAKRSAEDRRKAEEATRLAAQAVQQAEAARRQEEDRRRQEEEKRLLAEVQRLQAERAAAEREEAARKLAAEREAQARAAEAKRLAEEQRRKDEEQRRRAAEAEAARLEQEKRRAEEQRQQAEQERQRAEEAKRKVEQERKRAADDAVRAELERQRMAEEKQRAQADAQRAETERQRLEQALRQAEADKLKLAEQARQLEAEKQSLLKAQQVRPSPAQAPAAQPGFGGGADRAATSAPEVKPAQARSPTPTPAATRAPTPPPAPPTPVARAALPPAANAAPTPAPAEILHSGRFRRVEANIPTSSDALDDGEAVRPKEVSELHYRQVGTAGKVLVAVPGGARYSVNRRDSRTVVLTLWDTVIYDLRLLRSIDLRGQGGPVRYISPEVEGSLRTYVNLVIEHEKGVQIHTQGAGDTLTVVVEPTG